MNKSMLCFFRCGVWVTAILILVACGSQEDQAAIRYEDAVFVEAAGHQETAEKLYQQVIDGYPNTKAATEAGARMQQIVEQVAYQRALEKQASEVFERLEMYLEGYRATFGKLPGSIEEIGTSGYMFGPDYLAEIVPEDLHVFMLVDAAKGTYMFWAAKQDSKLSVGRSSNENALRTLPSEELVAKFERLTDQTRTGNLYFAIPKGRHGGVRQKH